MTCGRTLTVLLLALVGFGEGPATASAAPTLKGRAVWANPREAGTTEASVVAYVEQLAKAHVNTLIMELKTSAGLFWPSERFAPAVVAEYRGVRPAGRPDPRVPPGGKIAFHVWFFDFAEGAQLPRRAAAPGVARPEPRGQAHERGDPPRPALPHGVDVPGPAARLHGPVAHPGGREFAERYDVDAIHHDYVRYPGDLAPTRTASATTAWRPSRSTPPITRPPTPTTRSSGRWTGPTPRRIGSGARRSCPRASRTTRGR